jgi:hypothetical protein
MPKIKSACSPASIEFRFANRNLGRTCGDWASIRSLGSLKTRRNSADPFVSGSAVVRRSASVQRGATMAAPPIHSLQLWYPRSPTSGDMGHPAIDGWSDLDHPPASSWWLVRPGPPASLESWWIRQLETRATRRRSKMISGDGRRDVHHDGRRGGRRDARRAARCADRGHVPSRAGKSARSSHD